MLIIGNPTPVIRIDLSLEVPARRTDRRPAPSALRCGELAPTAVAEITLTDGSTLSARCDHPRGAPENPLSRAQIETKLRTHGKTRLSEGQIENVIAAVSALEQTASVRELMSLLRRAPTHAERSPRVQRG